MWRETFGSGLKMAARNAAPATSADHYNLATAIRIVRRMETSATRGAVFSEIKNKNALYRLVDKVYSTAGSRILQPLALFAYMLKCVLAVGPSDKYGAEALSISNFEN